MADSTHGDFSPQDIVNIKEVQGLSSFLRESNALLSLREKALKHFYQAELPTRAESKWKYSKAKNLLPTSWNIPRIVLEHEQAKHQLDANYDAEIWLDQEGQVQALLSADAQDAGFVVAKLDQAIADGFVPGQLRGTDSGLFESLNLATFAQGLYIKLPKGQKLHKPVLLHLDISSEQNMSRLLLQVEKNAEMSLIEDHFAAPDFAQNLSQNFVKHQSPDLPQAEVLVNSVSEIYIEENAKLQHSMLQRWSANTRGYHSLRAQLQSDAQYLGVIASLGGREVKLDTGSILQGQCARAELIGFILGDEAQKHDVHTEQSHQAAHTWSNINFKVALADRARAAYTGRIFIAEKAQHSEALQENRNLLLSETAQANSIPVLEILNQEVSCSHGATVSAIDPAPLQYMMSRGLPREQAMFLLLRAFLQDSLQKLPSSLVENLERSIEKRLRSILA